MSLLNLSKYPAYINRCIDGRTKLIAYGASGIAAAACPLQFDYYVSAKPLILPEHAKKIWHEKPLETLAQEDPVTTIIVVCSGTEEEAWQAVGQYGNFPVIRFFSYEFMLHYLPALANLPGNYQRVKKNTSARRAIVLRGQIDNENTFFSIQKIAHDHPDDFIVVSTWDDTPADWIKFIETVTDRVVVSPKPANPGSQNRNYQLTLAQRGLAAAAESGAEKCLICRHDLMFTKLSTLDGFDHLMEKFPLQPAVQARQKGRIIVPHLFTRYCLPYHASDIIAYGWLSDIAAFWNASEFDNRPYGPEFMKRDLAMTLDLYTREKKVIETFLWTNYIEKIGREALYTIPDWLDFLRDYLLVINLDDQGILWFSKDLRDITVPMELYKSCVTFNDWLQLSYAPINKDVANVDLTKVTWKDFGRSIGP